MNNYDVLNQSRKDLVESIIELMKREGLDWTKGWASNSRPYNPVSDIKYRGGNVLRLAVAAYNNGYKDPRWLTYTQEQEKGWQVKKGSHGVRLEKWVYDKEETVKDPVTGEEKKQKVRLEKPIPYYFTVFNAEQIAGIPGIQRTELPKDEVYKIAEDIIKSSECAIKTSDNGRCYYMPAEDAIYLPPENDFYNNEARLATALHEMAHSTGHKSRLDRPLISEFGTPGYAKEELVAELASAFMQQSLGINLEANLENHAAYLQSWIEALGNDPNELFRAAGAADKASDRIINNYERYIDHEKEFTKMLSDHRLNIADQSNSKNTIVINAYGGAGAGKTTACLDIAAKLKKAGYTAEYVQEYAKELVWEENWDMLDGSQKHQLEILKEQLSRQDRLYGKVDFIVTDAPILLNAVYNNELTSAYEKNLYELYSHYNNLNFVVVRDPEKFEKEGRIHNLRESVEKDNEIIQILDKNNISYEVHSHSTIDNVVDNAIEKRMNEINAREARSFSGQEMTEEQERLAYELNGFLDQYLTLQEKEKFDIDTIKADVKSGNLDRYMDMLVSYRQYNRGEILPSELIQISSLANLISSQQKGDIPEELEVHAAVESTFDFSDYFFSSEQAGRYLYRMVYINDYGSIEPLTGDVFSSVKEASKRLESLPGIKTCSYDELLKCLKSFRHESRELRNKYLDRLDILKDNMKKAGFELLLSQGQKTYWCRLDSPELKPDKTFDRLSEAEGYFDDMQYETDNTGRQPRRYNGEGERLYNGKTAENFTAEDIENFLEEDFQEMPDKSSFIKTNEKQSISDRLAAKRAELENDHQEAHTQQRTSSSYDLVPDL